MAPLGSANDIRKLRQGHSTTFTGDLTTRGARLPSRCKMDIHCVPWRILIEQLYMENRRTCELVHDELPAASCVIVFQVDLHRGKDHNKIHERNN